MGKRILRISSQLLLDMLYHGKEAHYMIEQGLPKDTRIVNFTMEGQWQKGWGEALLLLESSEWDLVPEGTRWPDIDVKIRSLYPVKGEYATFKEVSGS